MKYCIDRFENGSAVCYDEKKNQTLIEIVKLYENPHEGDWFELFGDKANFLDELTIKKRNDNIALLKDLTK